MKVRSRITPPVIDAEQFDGINVPEIVKQKAGWRWEPHLVFRSDAVQETIPDVEALLAIESVAADRQIIRHGDWVVTNEYGGLSVYDHQWFSDQFDVIEESSLPDPAT